MNLCESCGGGGNSKLGRFEAADLRAVKLDDAPCGSRFDAIPGCCTAAEAILCDVSRFCPAVLKTSVPGVGGVGSVVEGGMELAEVDEVAPGQYWLACAACELCAKSREGNLYPEKSARSVFRGRVMLGSKK